MHKFIEVVTDRYDILSGQLANRDTFSTVLVMMKVRACNHPHRISIPHGRAMFEDVAFIDEIKYTLCHRGRAVLPDTCMGHTCTCK